MKCPRVLRFKSAKENLTEVSASVRGLGMLHIQLMQHTTLVLPVIEHRTSTGLPLQRPRDLLFGEEFHDISGLDVFEFLNRQTAFKLLAHFFDVFLEAS